MYASTHKLVCPCTFRLWPLHHGADGIHSSGLGRYGIYSYGFQASATFDLYNAGRMKLVEQQMALEFEEQLKTRMADELQRLMAMDEDQRKVYAMRLSALY